MHGAPSNYSDLAWGESHNAVRHLHCRGIEDVSKSDLAEWKTICENPQLSLEDPPEALVKKAMTVLPAID